MFARLTKSLCTNPNAQNQQGETALMLAVRQNRLEVCRTLCRLGADPCMANDFGTTALMYAAHNGHTEICAFLLETCGVPIDVQDIDGETALMYAARTGCRETVAFFVQHRAQLDLADKAIVSSYCAPSSHPLFSSPLD